LSHFQTSAFSFATVCKGWWHELSSYSFYKTYCNKQWGVIFDDKKKVPDGRSQSEEAKKYIYERLHIENLPLRMIFVSKEYAQFRETQRLTDLRSLISLEEFISETKAHVLLWLKEIDRNDKDVLTKVLNSRLFYEDYDKYFSQDGGGAWVGEGWNGSFRIYDNKGSFITVNFDCYCQPGHDREHLKLSFQKPKIAEKHVIIWADAHDEESSIFNYENLVLFRLYLDFGGVTLLNLFCFLLNSMGKLFQFYRFELLSSDEFNSFWNKMERDTPGLHENLLMNESFDTVQNIPS